MFVPGKPLQSWNRSEAYLSEAPFRCSPLVYAPGVTHKHYIRMEERGKDQHSSLLGTLVNYDRNLFITFGPDFYVI